MLHGTHQSALGSDDSQEPPTDLLAQLKCAEDIARWIGRKNHCSPDELQELVSEVLAKLLADDCAVLRSFGGRSKLETYLSVVVQNLFRDFRNRRWGKFRPSAEARRLGKLAIRLEELQWKDDLSLAQACEILIANAGAFRAEIERIAARLPARTPRRFQGEESLRDLPAGTPAPDELLLAEERHRAFSRAVAVLRRALAELPAEDRLVLQMVFEQDLMVSEIARRLCLDQRRLYRRIEQLKRDLRRRLESEGVRREEADFILGA